MRLGVKNDETDEAAHLQIYVQKRQTQVMLNNQRI